MIMYFQNIYSFSLQKVIMILISESYPTGPAFPVLTTEFGLWLLFYIISRDNWIFKNILSFHFFPLSEPASSASPTYARIQGDTQQVWSATRNQHWPETRGICWKVGVCKESRWVFYLSPDVKEKGILFFFLFAVFSSWCVGIFRQVQFTKILNS